MTDAALATCAAQRRLADAAIAQLDDDELHAVLDPDGNSIAVLMQHLAGNMRSRWTDILTTDGEKPWRDRDGEFVDRVASRAELLADWDAGWACLRSALSSLTPADLERTVTIRGEPYTVPRAILRTIDHSGYHIGQIVLLAKRIRGASWRTITVPRGGTAAHNASLGFDPQA